MAKFAECSFFYKNHSTLPVLKVAVSRDCLAFFAHASNPPRPLINSKNDFAERFVFAKIIEFV